jgi:ADP-heptose:LPS heptosyltransferase
MKTLIAGPWVGEFGWELFAWQAYVRTLAETHDKTIVISRKNSKAIYEDFADQFISHTPKGGLADSFFMYDVDIKSSLKEALKSNNIALDENTTVLLPRRLGNPPHTHFTRPIAFGDQHILPKYICFGEKTKKQYDYIFHVRSRDLRKEDNWDIEKWKTLKDLLKSDKIGCIGTKKESGWIEGTDDLRDIDLKDLFNILRNSSYAFGPSSGPMHLASLCGLPHIVWSISQNKARYEENWNPLETPILFLDKFKWHPPADYIYEKFKPWKLELEETK